MTIKKKELQKQIEDLEIKNQQLRMFIKKIDDKELFESIKICSEYYHVFMYRKIPFDFLETVFYTHKNILLKHANGCFINELLDSAYSKAMAWGYKELIMHIPMYCINYRKTLKGIVFILMDPYRTIETMPMENVSKEDAEYCKGKMIIAKLVIPEDHRAVTSFELREYRPLKMTLRNIIGKDIPTNYNTLFTRFKDITEETKAIEAIDFIENYYRDKDRTIAVRLNDITLRIVSNNKKIGVWFINDKLWYGEEHDPFAYSSYNLEKALLEVKPIEECTFYLFKKE